MSVKVFMPKLSPTMEKTGGTLVKWHKKEGDFIKNGDLLADIETDKAVMEIEAPSSGTIGKILFNDGASGIKIGETIAIILEEGEDITSIQNIESVKSKKNEDVAKIKNDKKTIELPSLPTTTIEPTTNRLKASPLAKSIATINNVDLNSIVGSGPNGRIVKFDVINSVTSSKSNESKQLEDCVVPLSGMRSAIASRLLESKQTIPHFYLSIECEIDELLKLRKIKNTQNDKNKLSINDFFVKAASLALKYSPNVNSSWVTDGIKKHSSVDICVAISIEDGLVTPVIKNANKKTLSEISDEIKILAQKARDKKLKQHELIGGNMTISTLGMFGIKQFYAIINPPQSSILAIGKSEIQAIFDQKEQCFKPKNIVNITMSADHRVIDGVVGAKFLQKLKEYIENPIYIFS